MDVGFLQDTKLTQGIQTCNGARYNVLEMEAESLQWGGVAVVLRAEKGRHVEGTASFGPNMVSFLLMFGARRWYVVGEYMPPNDVPSVHCVKQALRAAPKGL